MPLGLVVSTGFELHWFSSRPSRQQSLEHPFKDSLLAMGRIELGGNMSAGHNQLQVREGGYPDLSNYTMG